MEGKINNYNILCLSSIDWDGEKERHQILMEKFEELGVRILYIENPGIRSAKLSKQDLNKGFRRLIKIFQLFNKKLVRKVSDNIYVATPLSIPITNHIIIEKINSYLYRWFVTKVIKSIQLTNIIMWTYLPIKSIHDLADELQYEILIYDCVAQFSAHTNASPRIERLDRMMHKRANMVFVDAFNLFQQKKRINKNIMQAPAGINHKYYSSFYKSEKIPADIKNISSPMIGYIGSLHNWLDLDLIVFIAESRPDYSIVLVGPAKVDLLPIKNINNIYILGGKEHHMLPQYINRFDVCIIPYTIEEYTKYVFPTKVFEYLALGKPIVSTALPEILNYEEFNNIISIAYGNKQFLSLLHQEIEMNNEQKIIKRIEVSKNNSWDKRFSTMLSSIQFHLKNDFIN
jgi:glycosyltransferase involved in cell wall biosynthesis